MGSSRHRSLRLAIGVAALAGGLALAAPARADAPPSAPSPTDERLAAAREDLRISRVTFDRVKARFYELLDPENFDPGVLADYAVYMEKVGALMERHRAIVREMEAIAGVAPAAADSGDWPAVEDLTFDPGAPVTDDELARLERELDASLAEFDQFLLDEQYEALRRMSEIEDASSEEMTDLAREAAAAVERLRDRGIDVDTKNPSDGQASGQRSGGSPGGAGGESGESEGQSGGQSGAGAGGEPGAEGTGAGAEGREGAAGEPGGAPGGREGEGEGAGEGGTAQEGAGGAGGGEGADGAEGGATGTGDGSGSGSGSGGSGDSDQPPGAGGTGGGEDRERKEGTGDRPPADDDDIVARQLREAAERETDPELKEKLWEEYDRYKGTSGGSS